MLPAILVRILFCPKRIAMAKHAANTTEAVPRFKAVEAHDLIIHSSDESDCALDDDFEQMLKRYTLKNTEASAS